MICPSTASISPSFSLFRSNITNPCRSCIQISYMSFSKVSTQRFSSFKLPFFCLPRSSFVAASPTSSDFLKVNNFSQQKNSQAYSDESYITCLFFTVFRRSFVAFSNFTCLLGSSIPMFDQLRLSWEEYHSGLSKRSCGALFPLLHTPGSECFN